MPWQPVVLGVLLGVVLIALNRWQTSPPEVRSRVERIVGWTDVAAAFSRYGSWSRRHPLLGCLLLIVLDGGRMVATTCLPYEPSPWLVAILYFVFIQLLLGYVGGIADQEDKARAARLSLSFLALAVPAHLAIWHSLSLLVHCHAS